jgi:CRISPR/Cas system-associated exonuclease Cas4 (RecB family)
MSNTKRPDPTDALPNKVKASASSLKLLAECKRKWYFEKILGLRPPSKSQGALQRGSELHAAVEDYLLGKTDVIEDPLAQLHATLLHEFKHAPGLTVESYYKFERAGVTIRGYIDLYTDKGIWDHKTTSSIKRYGEKPDTIAQNLQLNLYAAHWFSLYPHESECQVGHLQYQTKDKAVVALVEATLTRESVERFLVDVIDPLIKAQKEVAKAPGPEYVEPTTSACWNYGGCGFKGAECKPYHFREFRMPTKPKSVMLFLSARPAVRVLESLESLIAKVAADAPAKHPDLVDYGKGAALFAELICDEFEARESEDVIYVFARAEDKTARALIAALEQRQGLVLRDVVEGVR